MEKQIIIQIFTGGYKEEKVTYEQISEKLLTVLATGAIKRVIIGWSLQKSLYRDTIKLLKSYGVECFLWLPVFSETGMIKSVKRLLDDRSYEVENYSLKEGENFEFYCPQNHQNIQSFLEIYEENFSDLDFDGVFLDKIRYGSFSNGISGVFNCFCPECKKTYETHGISIDLIKEEMEKVRAGKEGYAVNPLHITTYAAGKYEFQNDLWNHFFEKKQDDITAALTEVADYFHKKNKLVGIDTFSPFMAYFVGQDIVRLGKIVDFVKPMMYRMTHAPAGLPFETECLIKETTADTEQVNHDFYKRINCHRTGTRPFDIQFVKRELGFLTDNHIPIYAGIEVNKNEAVVADPFYIRENLKELDTTDVEGFVLSWDLLTAPDDNIAEIIAYLQRRRESDGNNT